MGVHDRPLAWHLALFSLSLIAPILVAAGVLVSTYAQSERSRIDHELLRVAHEAMSRTDRRLASLVATTEVLALSRDLQGQDLPAFDLQAREVRTRLGINIVLRDRNGNQLVNTRVSPETALPQNVAEESDTAVMETRRPVISDLFLGAVSRTPVFMINVPVLKDGDVGYFLNLSVDPESIHELISETQSLEGTALTVIDRRGDVIARNAGQVEHVGRPLDPRLVGQIRNGASEGILTHGFVDDAGEAFVVGFSRSQLSGWTYISMLPSDLASAPLRRSLAGLVASGAMLLLIAVGFAALFARRIEKPVKSLALQAELLGRGEPITPLATRVRELNILSEALSISAARRLEVEQAVRNSEARLQLAQVAGSVGTWDWDPVTGVAVCSESYCRLYGLDPKREARQTPEAWLKQVHPDDRERVQRLREAALASGALESEYRIVRRDGAIRRIVDRGVGIFDSSGKLTRFLGANVDVTAAREAEERLREVLSELLHASRLSGMGQMAAALAHELSQPIGAAANYVNAARISIRSGGAAALDRALARLEAAATQTSRAGAILKRMRDFVSLGETDKRMVKVRQVVEDAFALALVGVRDPELRTRVAFHPSDRNPTILIDSVQIQQVIFNLVRNALEATAGQRPREITVTTRFRGSTTVEIAISDSGPGLPEDLSTLFKPFASTKSKGMGLGLSICRAIIEAHGGRLWAQPAPGGGAVFTFTIPIATQEAAAG